MTRRRDLERHRNSLGEIAEILGSMKTLAYMETRKLSRFLSAQRQIVESIEEAAADFLSFEPGVLAGTPRGASVALLIGSERGFCGDFNHTVVEALESVRQSARPARPRLIVVGHKLHTLLEHDQAVAACIEGPSVAEDVAGILQRLVDELNRLQPGISDLRLVSVYHSADGVRTDSLLPPFERQAQAAPRYAYAPVLNLRPSEFLLDLVEHYLLSVLNHMLFTSLMVENNRRVSHLDRAVQHIEDESGELTRKCRALRQEEIIEEIEVILLSASGIGDNGGARHD